MADVPWLTIVGVGEDGLAGLSAASRAALENAEIVMGPPRHLDLLPGFGTERIEWPVPFADGISKLLSYRNRAVVALASGDPFWFGAGSMLARHLDPGEWRALPSIPTFSLAASRLGWPLETVATFGLHAAPFCRLRTELVPGRKIILLVRDGAAVRELATFLSDEEFGESDIWVMETLAGPRERITSATATTLPQHDFVHPVCVAIDVVGSGRVFPMASGRPDDWFDHDGQITKRPIRALTLSALAPRPFERLWDIGAGSGSISIEWLLSHATVTATAIEADPARAERIRGNSLRLGADRLDVVNGRAPDALAGLAVPNAVFVGGGLNRELVDWITRNLPTGTRLVANAVTLESEALLIQAQAELGGDLTRFDISQPAPIGPRTGWKASYPITQWSHTL